MKQIIKKTIILIDGVEHVVKSCDFSESVADFQTNMEETLSPQKLLIISLTVIKFQLIVSYGHSKYIHPILRNR